MSRRGLNKVRFFDAIVALALVAEIHGTDKAVADAAKRFSKVLPRRHRQHMFDIMNSRSPLRHIKIFVMTLPEDVLELMAQTNGDADK
ncbi:DUF7740 domain-containing protein [Pseudomonas luteola]|uniref:DUF7740 domain-containing protein n=1 Tax=Pseudomonas luteola TaxID=47886 RepID=UPI003DA121A4